MSQKITLNIEVERTTNKAMYRDTQTLYTFRNLGEGYKFNEHIAELLLKAFYEPDSVPADQPHNVIQKHHRVMKALDGVVTIEVIDPYKD